MRFRRDRSRHLKITLFAIAVVPMLAGVPVAFCQITVAAIHGTGTDSSGAVVPNAKVTALNRATGIATDAVSNLAGYSILPSRQVEGPYKVTASAAGFATFVVSGPTLNANGNREALATLKGAWTPQIIPDIAICGMKYTKFHKAGVLASKPFL
jgi:hypothetical protein